MHVRQIKKSTGFTLVELMIVVAIIGVLAAVSIPLFQGYVKDAKKAEGREKLSALAKGAVIYYHMDHFYDANATDKRRGLYPDKRLEMNEPEDNSVAILPAPQLGTKGSLDKKELNQQPWSRLAFDASDIPLYYGFIYRTDNSGTLFGAGAYANLQFENDSRYIITGDENGRLSSMYEFNGIDNDDDGVSDDFDAEAPNDAVKEVLNTKP